MASMGLCLALLLLIAGAQGKAAPKPPAAPWSMEGQLWALRVAAAVAPAPPPAYSPFPPLQWLNTTGWILAAKFSASPVGPFSELVFIPGSYLPSPGACSTSSAVPPSKGPTTTSLSVQRMWVSTARAQAGRRSAFGYPAELASFKWSQQPGSGTVSLEVQAPASVVVFAANFTPALERRVPWRSRLDAALRAAQLQWPLSNASLAHPAAAAPQLVRPLWMYSALTPAAIAGVTLRTDAFMGNVSAPPPPPLTGDANGSADGNSSSSPGLLPLLGLLADNDTALVSDAGAVVMFPKPTKC